MLPRFMLPRNGLQGEFGGIHAENFVGGFHASMSTRRVDGHGKARDVDVKELQAE